MMRKLLGLLLFLAASGLGAQALTPYYLTLQPYSGGTPPASSSGSLPATPVLGDMVYFDGAAWVSIPVGAHIDGEVMTLVSGVPDWDTAGAAAGGYATVEDEGVAVAQETVLNCVGAGIACTAGAGKTTITVGAAAGAVALQGAYPGTPDTGNANIDGTYGSTQNGLAATISNFGLSLENNTDALVGVTREYSPGIRFLGSAWDTDGAVADTNAWQILGRPINGNTTSIDLAFYASLAGGAYAQKMYLSSGGDLTLGESGVSAGTLTLVNATSGSIVLMPPAGALGSRTLTLPIVTDTLAGIDATQTLTNKTLTTPTISGAITLPDDVTQTFNPGTTNSGLNVGSVAGFPSSADDGDIWYDSGCESFQSMTNGVLNRGTLRRLPPFWEDFTGIINANNPGTALTIVNQVNTGTGAGGTVGGWNLPPAGLVVGHPGLPILDVGTSGTGSVALFSGSTQFLWGPCHYMEFAYYLEDLPTSGSFNLRMGTSDSNSAAEGVDEILVEYTDNVNSGKLVLHTCNNSSCSDVNGTGVVVATDTFYKIGLLIDSTGDNLYVYENGAQIATQTAASGFLPVYPTETGQARRLGFHWVIQATTANASEAAGIDYVLIDFGTSR